MADPFSIVMATLKTIVTCKDFVGTIIRAPQSIDRLGDELSDIEGLLRQLGYIADSADEREMHAILAGPIANCEKVSKQVEKLVRSYVKAGPGGTAIWGRFSFGFKESDVVLLQRDMGTCKQTLSLAITSANL